MRQGHSPVAGVRGALQSSMWVGLRLSDSPMISRLPAPGGANDHRDVKARQQGGEPIHVIWHWCLSRFLGMLQILTLDLAGS